MVVPFLDISHEPGFTRHSPTFSSLIVACSIMIWFDLAFPSPFTRRSIILKAALIVFPPAVSPSLNFRAFQKFFGKP